ncbi:MAG: hypothetical protein ACYSWU_11815 [Planctomycetota bacterium]|jgi:hypothetical protein
MFVVRGVTSLLSLPFLWLGQVAAMLKMPLSVPLLRTAWYVGGDGKVAALALARIQEHISLEAARAQAAGWLAARPRPEIAAQAGLLALQDDQLEQASDFLDRGRQMGPDPTGMLELLDILVAVGTGDAEAVIDLARRFEQRTDLMPVVSKGIHEHFLLEALLARQFEEAERRAKRLWSIEDNPLAATTFWVLARRRGSQEDLEAFLGRQRLAAPQALYYQTIGHTALGDADAAQRTLGSLAEVDSSMAEMVRRYIQEKEQSA